ncbi:MAG: amidohydrolase family protein [Acidobacteria bacterium]|nr:amidohydrolase family protein [Acidobacteriota bacterium]
MYRNPAGWAGTIAGRPIRDGGVAGDGGVIAAVGRSEDVRAGWGRDVDLRGCAILPGLVNAHAHIELSGLRGEVPPAQSMPDWVRGLMARRAGGAPDAVAMEQAVAEARRCGTALVGDIGNTRAPVAALRAAAMPAVAFRELLGFDEPDPAALVERTCAELDREAGGNPRLRLAAHAPYSVSPALFQALRAAAERRRLWPLSVHVAESPEELEFLRSGTGPWRGLLEELGRWVPGWTAGTPSPVGYLDNLNWLGPGTLLVHGVHLTDAELLRIAETGATLVTCPRSNRWTGAGDPPIARFHAAGVHLAVGTDSLASAPDLNLFAELAELRRLAPEVPAAALLRAATLGGAEALGYGATHGAIAAGRRAALLAIADAGAADDVEEYLTGGVRPRDISWVGGEDRDSQ